MSQKYSTTLIAKEQQFDNNILDDYTAYLRKRYILNNKVLLIQSPQFLFGSLNSDIVRNRAYYSYPPTGLQCIAKALAGRNLDIKILDLNYLLLKRIIDDCNFDYHDWLEMLEERLAEYSPSIIGVTSINIYCDVFKPGYPLTSILRYLSYKDKYIIIAGGPIATNEYKNYLDKGLCHFVIKGEGENKINFLFDCLFNDQTIQFPIEGIYFKFNNSIEESNGIRDIVELKGNLIDAYDLIPIEDYHKVGSLNPYSRMVGQDKRFSAFQFNRGCRANCKFCGVTSFMGRGIRHYPVLDLLAEITYLVERKGVRHFDVLDDDFLVNRNEIRELLQGLRKLRQNYGITWSSNNGLVASSITEDLMILMRDSGCIGFRIGVESGNAQMLKKMRKPANLSLLRQVGAILNQFPEIFSGGNYIIGLLAEETLGEMLTTFKFCCELDLDWASFAIFQFTSKENIFVEKLKADGRATIDFVPSKSDAHRQISPNKKVVSGPDIFELSQDKVPSYEQIKEIWFSFNLVTNYINNKNLKIRGRPEKFTSWIEAVRLAYPNNPYMSLFSGLGSILLKDRDSAYKKLKITKIILTDSRYWNYRFRQFNLLQLVDNFPEDASGVYEALASLRRKYSQWMA